MKCHVRAKLLGITEWQDDCNSVRRNFAPKRLSDGLPFEYEFDIESECEKRPSEDEVKDRVLDEYADEFCKYECLSPTDCELEWEILKEYE